MSRSRLPTSWVLSGALTAAIFIAICCLAAHLIRNSAKGTPGAAPRTAARVLRLGLAPEQDIFRQHKAYHFLKDYLEEKLSTPNHDRDYQVELVTASSYAGVLKDFAEQKVDAAFMGSLLAVVAIDRYDATVALKSEGTLGYSTYSGVVFVLDASPAKSFDDLRGKRIGAVRTTMGGAVYPLYLMTKSSGPDPELVWSGTHDDVIREVVSGNLDAGAVKDLRLLAYQKANPDAHLRVLAECGRVPDNALVLRKDFPATQRDVLIKTLLAIGDDPRAAAALAELKVKRYLPCKVQEYSGLYQMLEALGPRWKELNLEGPVPRLPAESSSQAEGR